MPTMCFIRHWGYQREQNRDFPGSPVLKAPSFQCSRHVFDPWSETNIPHTVPYGQKIKKKKKMGEQNNEFLTSCSAFPALLFLPSSKCARWLRARMEVRLRFKSPWNLLIPSGILPFVSVLTTKKLLLWVALKHINFKKSRLKPLNNYEMI